MEVEDDAFLGKDSSIEIIRGNIPISSSSRFERPESSLINRLLARIRGWAIDDRLLAGAPVNGDPVTRARLAQLLDNDHRSRLAKALRRMLATAGRRHPTRFGAELPLRVREVLETEPLILRLASELEREESVNARGVILAERLIRDGTSPIYWRCQAAVEASPPELSIETAVRHARAALLMT
ncbi:MAG TPA: hypothetical protein VFY30_04685 [Solirubrobacterales bacterium]|nr:hypothetical protein [Solirubrobacterales bacterium]